MKLIDSHVHFWDPDHLNYEWLKDVSAINRPFLPGDLLSASGSHQIDGIVFVQADCKPEQGIEEAAWVGSLEGPIQGIVAFAPLESGVAVQDDLARLGDIQNVKGIRRLIQSEPLGFSVQPKFIEGIRQLPDFGFSFDICVVHHQLEDIISLVEQCPNVRFVLDHSGKPGIKNGLLDPWRAHIRTLAGFENVWCKVSGLVTEAEHAHWTTADLQPYFNHLLETFGPTRLMFGSDWPVVNLASTYSHWVDTFEKLIHPLSDDERDAIAFKTAQIYYGLSDD